MNNRLNEIQTTINGFYQYDDAKARHFISLVNESLELIGKVEATAASILEEVKNSAINELSNELASRLNESFFNAPLDRRKNEFKISKVLVSVAIGNVLSNLPSTIEN